ncbi:ankyrin repeat and protein kinase domain-containing protein 1-like isoform 4-T4 [Fundulus diaphanus]
MLCSEKFGDENLDQWTRIAGGGFGTVYRVRHQEKGFVAIKVLRQNTGSSDALRKEADDLKKMSSPYVLSVYGIYQGKPPHENTEQQGIVMEFMERGSIHNLTTDLDGPPPLPLAVQLVYQVALGMQHLHSNKFIHHDLKPSNVLLDKDFNVKLADFGLSRVTASVSSNIQQSTGGTAGTLHYMPPEAFGLNCKATRSFDVYSYGILLWSIFTGKEPYEGKPFELVAFRIQKGDRPDVSLLLNEKNETKKKMVELMRRCWDGDPNKRPTFNDIVEATKLLFSVHKDGIGASVQEVLSKLVPNSQRSSQDHQTNVAACDPSPAQGNAVPNDIVDHPRFAAQQRLLMTGENT